MTAWFSECYTKSDLTPQTIDWSSPRSGLAATSALAYLTPVDRLVSIPNEAVDAIQESDQRSLLYASGPDPHTARWGSLETAYKDVSEP